MHSHILLFAAACATALASDCRVGTPTAAAAQRSSAPSFSVGAATKESRGRPAPQAPAPKPERKPAEQPARPNYLLM